MTSGVNTRELILEILLQVNKGQEYSHLAIRHTLEKYQYLEKQERAFITRVCEGTLEYMLQIDYIINQFSTVTVKKMKPVVREILRTAVYQLLYMDNIPDSAVCNEAVKLAQKKGFYSLKGFINAVLRTILREGKDVVFPSKETPAEYLSVRYSMPMWLVEKWLEQFGFDGTEAILKSFLKEIPTTIRCQEHQNSVEDTLHSLKKQGVTVSKAPYVKHAYYIEDYNYIPALNAFIEGRIQIQDVSSMLVGDVANPQKGDYVIDLCAAPGGKTIHVADKMQGYGTVEARDVSEYKVQMIQDNIVRTKVLNAQAVCKDATVFHVEDVDRADIVLADVPCSGLGVIGKKSDIKYKMTPERQRELVDLQRRILTNAAAYVRTRGILIYSTCTIGAEENQENIRWFTQKFPFELESIDPYISEELQSETTKKGYLQLLPGIHTCDGFFVARLKKVK